MSLIVFLFSPEGLVPTRVADRKISDSLSYIVCLVYTDPAWKTQTRKGKLVQGCLVLSILLGRLKSCECSRHIACMWLLLQWWRSPLACPSHLWNSHPDGVHRFCWFTLYPPTVFPGIYIIYFLVPIIFRAVAILEGQRAGYPLYYSVRLFLPTPNRTQTSELLSELLW